MNLLETAYEILSEGRRSVAQMETTKRRYDVVKAHMYSIFECYAHGIIDWNTTKKYWKKSIVEYVKLYSYDKKAQLQEKIHMQKEYSNVLTRYKPALDEYRRVHESRLTTKLIGKKQLTENQARKQSNTYYNRCLTESDLKDTKRLKWNSVLESYPNLTSKDRQRVRLLTIFEGPTVSTTQMITTVMGEAGPTSSPRPRLRPSNLGGNSNIGSTEMGPNGQMTGSTRGFEDPGFEFNPRAGHRDQPSHPENRGLAPSRLAPTTSPRPKLRPDNLGQRAAINRAVSQAMGEGYKELPPINRDRYQERPGLEGPFSTLSGKVVYYDPKEGAYYDPDTDMYLSYDEFKALDNDRTGMKESARGLGSIDWPDMEDGYSDMAQHAENAIRHNMHAYDAFGHVYSMTADHRDWMNDNKDMIINMFASYGLQTESRTKPGHNMMAMARTRDVLRRGIEQSKKRRGIDDEEMSSDDIDEFHRALDALVHKHLGHGSHEVDERKMTKKEKSKEKRLKKKYDDSDMKASMKKQYGDNWEEVYYATIRKRAMENFSGAIASVAMPMGKMQRRKKTNEDDSAANRIHIGHPDDYTDDVWKHEVYINGKLVAAGEHFELDGKTFDSVDEFIIALSKKFDVPAKFDLYALDDNGENPELSTRNFQPRNFTEAKKKSPAGGPACWDGKKIHPTKPTKMKGGKRVNNCIDDGK